MDWETQIKQIADESWKKLKEKVIQNLSGRNLHYNYRAEHNNSVFTIGLEIGKKLKADMEILKAALLLHDIGRSVEEKDHGKVGAQIAGEILLNTNFPEHKIDAVKYAIMVHVGWDESIPGTLEARILWDADKLSKLGATFILQKSMVFSLKGKNATDAVSYFNNWLETAEFIKNNMKTELGSLMAEERYETLKKFVIALNKEMSFNPNCP